MGETCEKCGCILPIDHIYTLYGRICSKCHSKNTYIFMDDIKYPGEDVDSKADLKLFVNSKITL